MSLLFLLGDILNYLKHICLLFFRYFNCFRSPSMIVPTKDDIIVSKYKEDFITKTASSLSFSDSNSNNLSTENNLINKIENYDCIDLEVGLNPSSTSSLPSPTTDSSSSTHNSQFSDPETNISDRSDIVNMSDIPIEIKISDKIESLPPPPIYKNNNISLSTHNLSHSLSNINIVPPISTSIEVPIVSIPSSPRLESEFSSPISSRKRNLVVSPVSDVKKVCMIDSPNNLNKIEQNEIKGELMSTLPLPLSSLPPSTSLSSSLPAKLPFSASSSSTSSSLLTSSSKVLSLSEQEKLMNGAPEGEIYEVDVVEDNLLQKFGTNEEALARLNESIELFFTPNLVWATQCEIITVIRRFLLFHYDIVNNNIFEENPSLLIKILNIANTSLTNIRSLNVRNSIFLSTTLLTTTYSQNNNENLSFFYYLPESSQLFTSLIMKLANGPKFLVEKSFSGCCLTIKTLINKISEIYNSELKIDNVSNSLKLISQSLHWIILSLSSTISNKNSEVSSKSIELLCEFLTSLPADLFKLYFVSSLNLKQFEINEEDIEEVELILTKGSTDQDNSSLDLLNSNPFLEENDDSLVINKLNDEKKKLINEYFNTKKYIYNEKQILPNLNEINNNEKEEIVYNEYIYLLFSKLFYYFYLGFTNKKGIIKEKLKLTINKLNNNIQNNFYSFISFFSFFLNDNNSLVCIKEIEKSSTCVSLSSTTSSLQSFTSTGSRSFIKKK